MSKRPFLSGAFFILFLITRSSAQQIAASERALPYEPYIATAATRYGVDPKLLWTIAYLETRFNPRLVSRKGARGLMQFVPSTGRKYGLVNPFDPVRSIEAAAQYVRDLSAMFNQRVDLVLAGYNAGEQAVKDAGYKVPAYRETRSYVSRGINIFSRISEAGKFSSDKSVTIAASARDRSDALRSRTKQSIYTEGPAAEKTTAQSTASQSIYFGDR